MASVAIDLETVLLNGIRILDTNVHVGFTTIGKGVDPMSVRVLDGSGCAEVVVRGLS